MFAAKRCYIEKLVKPVKAREFCRLWFDADAQMESARGYRAECVRLLSRILSVQTETISSKWGSGIDFEKMPEHYERTLAYANSLRSILDAAGNNEELASIVTERLKQSR
ncbi:hypothetical protein K4039_14695 [Lyngbya sp. CCAP 1446/10]|jgi:hypothetical protein|uniref:hypothetical protein n=1 Tax=Lyngbya sp. CCAP 1446/10 TaxID=439293 RepID=UPI00223779AF|nr:hypothetical protein [Lyngbya sp. CCAP 1446/10]MCW6051305.1 hypothetical protein [Lyngbya sp. CCAP 1446/10]